MAQDAGVGPGVLVVALGGNALLRRGETPDARRERARAEDAAAALAPVLADRAAVVTHGNGPQVGLLAERSATTPLDVLGAQTEGAIGLVLEQALRDAIPGRECATLLTQTVVDPDDPAFTRPTKPIGPVLDEPTARRLAAERGWTVGPDGAGWRRLVPSPEPIDVVELRAIEVLLAAGVLVVCSGGGGVPVVRRDGTWHGVEAVIDKDLAASLLAVRLQAARLVLLTDVEAVHQDWGTPRARALRRLTVTAGRSLDLPAGSMGPKVEACCRFVERTGGSAVIGSLEQAAEVAAGRAGTEVVPDARDTGGTGCGVW